MNWLLALLLLTSTALVAQPSNPHVTWKASAKKTAPNTYTLTLSATIAEHWYVYSQYLESDEGPIPTQVVLEDNSPWKTTEAPQESGEQIKGYDELFGMTITKYKHRLVIQQTLTTQQVPTTIKGYITFMSCDDHQCLPPTDVPFEVDLR